MFGFVLFEIFITFPQIMKQYNDFGGNENEKAGIIYLSMTLGSYLILQSFSILYLKPSKDPLESITNLDYLQLLSINQRINEEFMKNMYADTQWKNLTRDQKNDFKEAFLGKSNNRYSTQQSEDLVKFESEYDYNRESEMYRILETNGSSKPNRFST